MRENVLKSVKSYSPCCERPGEPSMKTLLPLPVGLDYVPAVMNLIRRTFCLHGDFISERLFLKSQSTLNYGVFLSGIVSIYH